MDEQTARAAARMLRDPVIGILLLAGVAEILAGDPLLDWLILLAVAAALSWDRVRGPRPGPARVGRSLPARPSRP